jgi:F0F1-type ATP synthase assembly protein I
MRNGEGGGVGEGMRGKRNKTMKFEYETKTGERKSAWLLTIEIFAVMLVGVIIGFILDRRLSDVTYGLGSLFVVVIGVNCAVLSILKRHGAELRWPSRKRRKP